MQIKITMIYQITSFLQNGYYPEIKMNKCWQEYDELRTLNIPLVEVKVSSVTV